MASSKPKMTLKSKMSDSEIPEMSLKDRERRPIGLKPPRMIDFDLHIFNSNSWGFGVLDSLR